MKKVLLVCSGGITSQIWAMRLNELNSEYHYAHISESFLIEVIADYEIVLFAPQTRVDNKYLETLKKEYNVKCFRIPDKIYAHMDDQGLLAFLIETEKPKVIHEKNSVVVTKINKLSKNIYLQLVMRAIMSISILMIGVSLFQIILSLPLGTEYQQFLENYGIKDFLTLPVQIFSNMISIFLCVSIGYNHAKLHNVAPIHISCFTLLSYLCLIPLQTNSFGNVESVSEILIALQYTNYSGILIAVIVGMLSSYITIHIYQRCKKKIPVDIIIHSIQCITILFVFSIIRWVVQLFGFNNVFEIVESLMNYPVTLVSSNVYGYAIFIFLTASLWFFGVHGPMLIYTLIIPLHTFIYYANITAFSNGLAAPYPAWFLNPWVSIGGSGATLALNILMLYNAQSAQLKSLGKISIMTSIFNINEPLIYGLPIVFNIQLVIPFVSIPLINLFIAWMAMDVFHIVSYPTGAEISNYFFVGINAWLTNQSISGLLLFIFILSIDIIIWYPFFKNYDIELYNQEM